MSTAGGTTPATQARVYCEPFVYTSMVTKTGSTNGYRMVAKGERLHRLAEEAVNEMSDRMVVLTQAVDPSHDLFAYFTTGGAVPLVAFLKCTANLDWQGRPGGFCSGLAFRRDELASLPGFSPHSLDFSALPFLTQDQILSFLKSAGEQGNSGLVLKGLHLKPVSGYFRPGERQYLATHIPQFLSLARRLESGDTLHARKDQDTWRVLRLVSLVLPARLRASTSAVLGARRGLERVGRVQLWLDSDQPAAGIGSLLSGGSSSDGDPAFAQFLGDALNNPALSDEQVVALLAPDPAIESVKEFWSDVRQSQHRQELARARSLKGRPPAETATTFASLVRRSSGAGALIAERFEAWQNEPDLLASLLQTLRVSHADAYNRAAVALGEAWRDDTSTHLRAALGKPVIWRTAVLRDFWLKAWSEVDLPAPDEALIVRVLELDETAARAWLEHWVAQHPALFLQSPAFRASALWANLSPDTRRSLYRSCLEAGDAELRVLAAKNPALSDFIDPADLEFFDGAAFGDGKQFVHRFESRREPAELFALWAACTGRAGFEKVAQHALWSLVDVLPKLPQDQRLAVLRAVREGAGEADGAHTLFGRAEKIVESLRDSDPDSYDAARRELFGETVAPAEDAAAPASTDSAAQPARVERSTAAKRGNKGLLIAIAAVVVVAGGVGAFLALKSSGGPDPYVAETEYDNYLRSKKG